MLTTIGFDADDTLWHNETFFRLTQERFFRLLADHSDPDHLHDRLLAAERRNLGAYGFGVKGFTLSMIETAVEVSAGKVPAAVIGEILAAGREMLSHPVDLLPHARATVTTLAADYRVVLITKGDLLDQERKVAQSGLGDLVHGVEIVSDKTEATYRTLFARHGTGPEQSPAFLRGAEPDVQPLCRHRAGFGAGGPQHPAPARRSDQLAPNGARLRYVACPQAPFLDSTEQEPCSGL